MTKKLKRDQISAEQAKNWRKNFKEEANDTFKLKLTPILLQKETYKILVGENENRVRIYMGLDQKKEDGKYVLCAYAVSAFLMGSGDVYADYEMPVFKLEKKNVNYSDDTQAVIESIRLYRKWRAGELGEKDAEAPFRKYIYPNGYLLTKYELHELFNAQGHAEVNMEFGIQKTMSAMLTAAQPDSMLKSTSSEMEEEVFDLIDPCPPDCHEGSFYNS